MKVYHFVLLGARATGKTTYLASLYAEEPTISANDLQTVSYLKEEWAALVQGRVHPTPFSLYELLFLYRKEDTKITFTIDDYDGYFAESLGSTLITNVQHHGSAEYETLKRKIVTSDGLLFFFPYETELHIEGAQNFRTEINTYIQLINDFYPDCTTLPIPVVLAVTKWDRSPHYGAADERDHAIAYLESIEVFRQAKHKIDNFFPNVHVVPMACFHPETCMVPGSPPSRSSCPYNLTKPFDIFLEAIFHRIEDQIAVLQNHIPHTTPRLYTYLCELDSTLYRYRGGNLDRLRDQVETDYVEIVINLLAHAHSPRARKDIFTTHNILFERCHSPDLKDHLTRLRAMAKRKDVRDRWRISMIRMAIVTLMGMMTYATFWLKDEATAFIQVIDHSIDQPIMNRLVLAEAYLNDYPPHSRMNLFLSFIRDLPARHTQVEQLHSSLYGSLETTLSEQLSNLQTISSQSSLTIEQRSELDRLAQTARQFPHWPIAQNIDDVIERVAQEQHTLKEIEAFFIEIESLLNNQSQDIDRLQNVLNRVIALSQRQDAVIRQRMSRLALFQSQLEQHLHTVKQTRLEQQRLQAMRQAQAMLDASISDRLTLESALALLEPFAEDSRVIALQHRLTQRIAELRREERFDDLYRQLLQSHTIEELSTQIVVTWPDSGFTDIHRLRLQTLLDGKISSFEFRLIASLTDHVLTFQDLAELEATLEMLDRLVIEIPIIDYRYVRHSDVHQQQIDQAKQTVTRYRQALDQGVIIRQISLTIDDQTNPLGLNCPIRGNSEGQLEIMNITLDQERAVCEYHTHSQIMNWTTELRLGLGDHLIELRELDSFLAGEDDILRATITLAPEDLLRLINGDLVSQTLPGNYELSFLTKAQE